MDLNVKLLVLLYATVLKLVPAVSQVGCSTTITAAHDYKLIRLLQ